MEMQTESSGKEQPRSWHLSADYSGNSIILYYPFSKTSSDILDTLKEIYRRMGWEIK